MISVSCRTNLDLEREEWPTKMVALPSIGHRIKSKKVHKRPSGNFQLELEVYAITWEYDSFSDCWKPEIELHVPKIRNWDLVQFYQWYAPLVGKSVEAFI